jgi:tight adherence protein B
MNAVSIRLLVLLGVFASVFLLSQILLGVAWRRREGFVAINRRLDLIEKGNTRENIIAVLRKNAPVANPDLPSLLLRPYTALQRMLFTASVPMGPSQLLLAMTGGFLAIFVLLSVASRFGGFDWTIGIVMFQVVLAGCTALVLPITYLNLRAQRRRTRIEEQFPVALDIFVRAIRSGHPIASALEMLTHELDDPIGSEFGLATDEVSYGADLNDALQAMAERWDNDDMRMFVVSLSLQSQTGGNLAEILENLAEVIRARAAMYMKVRALSSEGRLTAWILSILPVVSLIGMFLVNPSFYLETARDPIFVIGFSGLILLYIIGLVWIRRMIDLKV